MTVDGLGCLIWWELGFQPEIIDLRIIKKIKKKAVPYRNFVAVAFIKECQILRNSTFRIPYRNPLFRSGRCCRISVNR